MGQKILRGSVLKGLLGSSALLIFYFVIVTSISGWDFAQSQFLKYWYFIVSLVIGFGIQVGLYFYLRDTRFQNGSTKVLATSGTTSGAAMISCCSHYLVNILPILGVTGVVTFIGQYQIQFFWIGLVLNIIGIFYMVNRVIKVERRK